MLQQEMSSQKTPHYIGLAFSLWAQAKLAIAEWIKCHGGDVCIHSLANLEFRDKDILRVANIVTQELLRAMSSMSGARRKDNFLASGIIGALDLAAAIRSWRRQVHIHLVCYEDLQKHMLPGLAPKQDQAVCFGLFMMSNEQDKK